MLRTEAYASKLGTLSDARRLFGNVGRGSTSLRGRGLKGKGKGVFGARETRGAREEGGKETPARIPLFSPSRYYLCMKNNTTVND